MRREKESEGKKEKRKEKKKKNTMKTGQLILIPFALSRYMP